MKNESLTPNPSPKGEGSKMKNEKYRTFSSAKQMKNENYSNEEGKIYSSFYVLHSSLTSAFLLASICANCLIRPYPTPGNGQNQVGRYMERHKWVVYQRTWRTGDIC